MLKRQKGADWENANTHNQSGLEPQPKYTVHWSMLGFDDPGMRMV